MEAGAPANEVLLAESTLDLVRDAVEVEPVGDIAPKGETDGVPGYRLIAVTAPELAPDRATHDGSAPEASRSARRPAESRKTVTIVFSDIHATALDGRALPPKTLREAMARSFDAARRVLEAHGGTVEKYIGDAVMAVFGLPVRHEDDALRAAHSALQMQEVLATVADALAAEYGVKLHVAIGVNSGEVVAGDASLGQRLVTGDAVNVAARLEQAAPDRGVIMGDLSYRLARGGVDGGAGRTADPQRQERAGPGLSSDRAPVDE